MSDIPLVVEGDTDTALFRRVASLAFLGSDVGLEHHPVGGRGNIAGTVAALVGPDTGWLMVAEDIDDRDPPQVVESLRQAICNRLGEPIGAAVLEGDSFRIRETRVTVIAVGLPGNRNLMELGISHHALEDYLIELVLSDSRLRPEHIDFLQLLRELVDTLSRHQVWSGSSKDLFHLMMPIGKWGYSETGVVEALFENANPEVLRRVMSPLVERVAAAMRAATEGA